MLGLEACATKASLDDGSQALEFLGVGFVNFAIVGILEWVLPC